MFIPYAKVFFKSYYKTPPNAYWVKLFQNWVVMKFNSFKMLFFLQGDSPGLKTLICNCKKIKHCGKYWQRKSIVIENINHNLLSFD